jgi:FkbM family methyltransferase
MSATSRIRHSIIGRSVRKVIHAGYRLQNPPGKPVSYSLPGAVRIRLYPEGEVAEFLAVQRFFEKTELALVAAYLKPGMTVIDVGANIGVYSILASKIVGPTGMAWAFEPSLESYQRLEKNLQLNGCDRVQPVRAALSTLAEGFLQLKSDAGFGDAYRYLASAGIVDAGNPHSERVAVTTLDAFSRRERIGDAAFLKIDVEGGEYAVFQGAQDFLRSSPNASIMFESDPEWCQRAGCRQEDSFELLARLGFGLYAWQNRSRKWVAGEKALLAAGTVWACRDASRLPVI